MTRIVTLLTEGYADWETALLNAVARSFYRVDTVFASPDGLPITSAGGLHATPERAWESLDIASFDAVVVSGGTIWLTPEAPDLAPLIKAAHNAGKVVAGICDGVFALARTGLLDNVRHTGNGPGALDGSGYRGAGLYEDVHGAVADRGVVTAPGTAPVSFMAEIMGALGLRDENLAYYVGLHAAEHRHAA